MSIYEMTSESGWNLSFFSGMMGKCFYVKNQSADCIILVCIHTHTDTHSISTVYQVYSDKIGVSLFISTVESSPAKHIICKEKFWVDNIFLHLSSHKISCQNHTNTQTHTRLTDNFTITAGLSGKQRVNVVCKTDKDLRRLKASVKTRKRSQRVSN